MSTPRDPDFVIVGAMRCGTTSLFHWLRAHPQVFVAGKELHYFDRHYEHGPSWYRSHFKAASERQLCGEGTPAYLYLSWARERLAQDLPDARLVVTLRDPVDRAWSHYWHNHERGVEPLSFEDALAAEPKRLRTPRNRARYSYLDRGRYAGQLEHLFALVGRERVLVLLFERDIVKDQVNTFRRVARFIGLDDDIVPDTVGQRTNDARSIRSPRLRRASLRLPRRLRNAIGHLNSAAPKGYSMPDVLRPVLAQEYAAENRRLEELLGLQIPWTLSQPLSGRPGQLP